jgi:dTDP-4-dehydrorhamnose reductase
MRILLLGARGQVGHELRGPLSSFAEVVAVAREIDLGDPASLRKVVADTAPHAIVNGVAYNEVDRAEEDRRGADRLNRDAVAILGEEARARSIALVTYSTDFVFDGESDRPYREDDEPRPRSAYGASKRAGEEALRSIDAPALIFRTAWVWTLRRRSFVSTILRAAREREILRVVDDQIGSPTFARDLAVATAAILFEARRDPHGFVRERRGIYHLAGSGSCSRHALATAAITLDPRRAAHRVRSIEPVPSSAFPAPARRPRHAPLDCGKARAVFGIGLPDWREALERGLADVVD